MLSPALKTVLRTIGQRIAREQRASDTDEMLLECFFQQHEAEAFELLLRRHGPMVLGVCRRILGEARDAEDVFQATFLILLRKGRRIVPRGKLANWLYTVARHAALRARANRARRRHCERQAMIQKPSYTTAEPDDDQELHAIVDEELNRLPEKYRAPLILCYLEGRTQESAARELGWPLGTLFGRLARARACLRQRLSRRGITLPTGLLAALWFADAAPAVPPALLASTTGLAEAFVAGHLAVGLSASVHTLAQGVMQTMWITKLKMAALLVAVSAALAGSGVLTLRAFENKPAHDHAAAHPGDPVKQEEHTALFDLVSDCDATHRAVADGAWGDAKTWDKGSVPGAGARVVIPKERTVTVAAQHDKERLDWIRVDGKLRFDPKVNTALKVITLVGNVKSNIEIGTEKERIRSDKTARLILGDRGERNDAQRQRDPYDLLTAAQFAQLFLT